MINTLTLLLPPPFLLCFTSVPTELKQERPAHLQPSSPALSSRTSATSAIPVHVAAPVNYSASQMSLFYFSAGSHMLKNHMSAHSYTCFCNYVYVCAFKLKSFSLMWRHNPVVLIYFHVFTHFLVFQGGHCLRLFDAGGLTLYCIIHNTIYAWRLCYVCDVSIWTKSRFFW